MKLTPYERLKNKRDRDFQARVSERLDDAPKSVGWKLLNSPFVLWFLSVVLLASASYCFTSFKQCSAEADEALRNFSALRAEIGWRREQLLTIAESATSLDEVRGQMNALKPLYGRYKEYSLYELLDQYVIVAGRIRHQNAATYYEPSLRPETRLHQEEKNLELWTLWSGHPSRLNSQISLEEFREFAHTQFMPFKERQVYALDSLCTNPTSLFSYMFLGSSEVAEALRAQE